MKPLTTLVITLLLLCSAVCWGVGGTPCTNHNYIDKDNNSECDICGLDITSKPNHWDLNIRGVNTTEKQLNDMKDTLDKIYSMVADLEVKFMGQERYNQIYDPTNEGEVAKQKRYQKERIKELSKMDKEQWERLLRQMEFLNNSTKE